MTSLSSYIGNLSPGALAGLLILLMIALYVARQPAHRLINSLFGTAATALRLGARSCRVAADRLRVRNREVLLHHGRLQAERDISKEFSEISDFVQRDLGGYPQIQRQIQQQITLISDDYERSAQVPAPLPEWVDAVEAVSKIRKQGNSSNMSSSILEQIHRAAELQHKELLAEQRKLSAERHTLLKKMTPAWRRLSNSIDRAGNALKDIVRRSERIDAHMQRFNEVVAGTDKAERTLLSSALCQFTIAALVIAIAIGGAFFNFHLIALPMSEMVGSLHRVAGVQVSDIAALVIICLEITAGIFLLESLRITRLFPLIGSMDDRMRRLIMIGAASTLLILASTEAALAFMRDQIAADTANLRASLAGTEAQSHAPGINSWIPLGANMVLGFVLPLALTMAAIPLEYLLQTGRSVFGSLFEWLVRLIATAMRIASGVCRQLSGLLTAIYDLLIAGPIWLESQIKGAMARTRSESETRDDWTYQSVAATETHKAEASS